MRRAGRRRSGRLGRLVRRSTGSVRVRVTVLAAGVFAVALVAASSLLLDALERRLVGDLRASAADTLQFTAGRIVGAAQPLEVPVGAVPLAGGTGVAFQVSSGTSSPVVAIAAEPGTAEPGIDVVIDTGAGGTSAPYRVTYSGPMDVLTSSPGLYGVSGQPGPFIVSTVQLGDGVALSTVSSLAGVDQTLDATRSILWVVVPVLVLIVAALSWVLVSRALRPVRQLTAGAAAITSESLSERLPVPASHDEVAELASTMNSMLERLERATTTSRRLVSDASHELRTPITVMRTELEVARRDGGVAWDDVSDRVLGEVDRMQVLVDDLLLLARLGERGATSQQVSVVDLAHDAGARRRRVPVTVVALDEVDAELEGDAVALGRAVDHLVANAARHANSRVDVAIEQDEHGVSVHVDDDGPGIPEDEREVVTQRFVRLDEGRARDAGGSGLGLAVATEVAAAHGGSLSITTSPLGGARVSIVLPARAPSYR